jgi:hypothetical protein
LLRVLAASHHRFCPRREIAAAERFACLLLVIYIGNALAIRNFCVSGFRFQLPRA